MQRDTYSVTIMAKGKTAWIEVWQWFVKNTTIEGDAIQSNEGVQAIVHTSKSEDEILKVLNTRPDIGFTLTRLNQEGVERHVGQMFAAE